MGDTIGQRKFREWIAKLSGEGVTARAIGVATGLTEMQVSHIKTGRRRPSFAGAVSIQKATDGEISVEDWILDDAVAPT